MNFCQQYCHQSKSVEIDSQILAQPYLFSWDASELQTLCNCSNECISMKISVSQGLLWFQWFLLFIYKFNACNDIMYSLYRWTINIFIHICNFILDWMENVLIITSFLMKTIVNRICSQILFTLTKCMGKKTSD